MKRRAKGTGTIYRRKDGRWAGEIDVTLSNGEQKRALTTSKSREVVRSWLRKIRDQENRKIPYSEKDWTVAEYLDYWMQDVQVGRIRETTMEAYNLTIKKHLKPTLGSHKLQNLRACDIRHALDMLEKRGCLGATIQKSLWILSACLNCALREEVIQRNVAQLVEKPKYNPKETRIWTVEQAALFLHSVKDHPHFIAFLLLLTYGMRRGEVLGLRWSDIDFENELIHVRQQIGRINGKIIPRNLKTANSLRTLPLMTNVREALMNHAKKCNVTPSQFVPYIELSTQNTVIVSKSGTPLEPRNLGRLFDVLTKKVGLPRIKVHAMRHTAATVLKDLNVPIKDAQLILGHANILTTMKIYQHGTPEAHRTAISAVEDRLLGRHVMLVNI